MKKPRFPKGNTPAFSPNGALVNSQGREPLVLATS
jgi:hypothetical protein